MSISIKKRVLALIATLALVVAMMVPAFAVGANEYPLPSGRLVYLYADGYGSAYPVLNILANNYASVKNESNLTTWPSVVDDLQKWACLGYGDGVYRIITGNDLNKGTAFTVDYWHGSSNYGNASVHQYDITNKSSSYAIDCAVRPTAVNNAWRFPLAYRSNLYLTATVNAAYQSGSTVAYDVRWTSYTDMARWVMNLA